MKPIKLALGTVFINLSLVAFAAQAQQTSPVQQQVSTARVQAPLTSDQIKTMYENALLECQKTKGKAEDLCEDRAKTTRGINEAKAKAAKEISEANEKLTKRVHKLQHNLEKKQCGLMTGDAKSTCEAKVETKYSQHK